MDRQEEPIREIIKGLEGLELLCQWELSLTRDLRGKTEALLRPASEDTPTDSPPSPSQL
jgi:hypothetical protein